MSGDGTVIITHLGDDLRTNVLVYIQEMQGSAFCASLKYGKSEQSEITGERAFQDATIEKGLIHIYVRDTHCYVFNGSLLKTVIFESSLILPSSARMRFLARWSTRILYQLFEAVSHEDAERMTRDFCSKNNENISRNSIIYFFRKTRFFVIFFASCFYNFPPTITEFPA